MRWQLTGLWRHPEFMKLWTGQTISSFGSTMGALYLTALLFVKAGPAQMGIFAAVGYAPVLVVGLLAGAWVDRLRRRPILIAADMGRALLLTSVPVAALLGLLRIEQLYIVAALVGAVGVFFDVAYRSFLPSLVERDRIVEGNSKLGASDSLAEIAGPAVGGGLAQLVSAPFVVAIDALTFLFSALFIGLIQKPEPPPTPPEERGRIWHEIIEGLRTVLLSPLLRPLTGSLATRAFFGGFFGSLYGLYVIRVLGMGPAAMGVLVGAGGAGALMGALVAGRAAKLLGPGRTIVWSAIITGSLAILIPLARGPVAVAFSMLMIGQLAGDMMLAVYSISELSLRQAVTRDRLLGRVNASVQFMVGGFGTVGSLAGGALGGVIGIRPTVAVAALGILLSCLWLIFSPVRTLHKLPSPPEEPSTK